MSPQNSTVQVADDPSDRAFSVAISLAVTILAFAAILSTERLVDPALMAAMAQGTVHPVEVFRPEPAERLGYAASAILVCLMAFATRNAKMPGPLQRLAERLARMRRLPWALAVGAAVLATIFSMQLLCWIPLPSHTVRLVAPVFYLVLAAVVHLVRVRLTLDMTPSKALLLERLGIGVGVSLVLLQALSRLEDEAVFKLSHWGFAHHFSAFGGPIFEVASGKTVLVNAFSMYGLYPHVYAALLPTPVTIRSVSLMATALSIVSLGALLATLHAVCRSVYYALLLFAFYLAVDLVVSEALPYYQHYPTRTLFPMLALLVIHVVRTTERATTALTAVIALFCVPWNFETGVVTIAALTAHRWQQSVVRGQSVWMQAVAMALPGACAAVGVATTSLMLHVRSGQWPDWLSMGDTAALFYGRGFYLLPMPRVPHFWMVVWSTYATAVVVGIRGALRRDQKSTGVLATAVLGFGLYSYYQGRSVDISVAKFAYPALILLGMWIRRQNESAHARAKPKSLRTTGAIAFLLLPIVGAFMTQAATAEAALQRGLHALAGDSVPHPSLVARRAFIRQHGIGPREQYLGISDFAWLDNHQLGVVSPFPAAGLVDTLLKRDMDALESMIRSRRFPKLFVGLEYQLDFRVISYHGWLRVLRETGYRETARSSVGLISLYELSPSEGMPPPATVTP